MVDPQSQPNRGKKQIVDLLTWVQIYAAGLAAADSTTKERVMGLMAHMFLVVQLSQDLGGNHWLQYDKDFREWAAAKNLIEYLQLGRAKPHNLWKMSGNALASNAGDIFNH